MKECENCFWSYRDEDNRVLCAKTEACLSHRFWKPDYPTLESENVELKQRIDILELALEWAACSKTEYENYIEQAIAIIKTERDGDGLK